jgi:hypothetical protein
MMHADMFCRSERSAGEAADTYRRQGWSHVKVSRHDVDGTEVWLVCADDE